MIRLEIPGTAIPAGAAVGLYTPKPTSFAFSVLIHAAIVAVLWTFGSIISFSPAKRPIYDAEIRPHESKIIWYRFKRGLPEVKPVERVGTSPQPQGRIKSPDTIIAVPKTPTKSKQFILHDSPAPIEQEVKAPNLLAVSTPPPPGPPPKQFVPPPPKQQPKVDTKIPVMEAPVAPELNLPANLPVSKELQALQKRAFVPPPPSVKPKLTLPETPALEVEDARLAHNLSPSAPLNFGGGSAPHLPAPPAPPQPAGGGGTPGSQGISGATPNSNVNAVIVGLNPSDKLGAIPAGSRAADISMAPRTGSSSTGNTGLGSVPGLMTRGTPGATMDIPSSSTIRVPPPKDALLYSQMIAGPLPSTLSAPLRPSSRRIPAALEARFQNRVVYALAIPPPGLPEYTGYWTMWFAERGQTPSDAVQMRAPLPYSKARSASKAGDHPTSELRVQVALVLDETGRVESLNVVHGAAGPAMQAVLNDVSSWQFKPATRNGKPVAVEVVVEIPFRLETSIARQ